MLIKLVKIISIACILYYFIGTDYSSGNEFPLEERPLGPCVSQRSKQRFSPVVDPLPTLQGEAISNSYITRCAEEDNVNILIFIPGLNRFQIIATNPTSVFGEDNSTADFSGCNWCSSGLPQERVISNYSFILYDDGSNVVEVNTDSNWWRGSTMNIKVIGGGTYDAHNLVLYRRIEGENSFPQFLVLYQDGNMRLKPHPPQGVRDNKFGSSIVIGPTSTVIDPNTGHERPYADIEEVIVDPQKLLLDIKYRDGSSAQINLSVSRDQAVADIAVNYDTQDKPFAIFRSMYVSEENCDAAYVRDSKGNVVPILGDWNSLEGPSWFIYREHPSIKNTSAPNILINAVN